MHTNRWADGYSSQRCSRLCKKGLQVSPCISMCEWDCCYKALFFHTAVLIWFSAELKVTALQVSATDGQQKASLRSHCHLPRIKVISSGGLVCTYCWMVLGMVLPMQLQYNLQHTYSAHRERETHGESVKESWILRLSPFYFWLFFSDALVTLASFLWNQKERVGRRAGKKAVYR